MSVILCLVISHYGYALDDSVDSKLLPFLDAAVDFVATATGKGACFVHCKGGKSRSASIVIAYLMKHRGLTFDKAKEVVRHGRPDIQPNAGFEHELRTFEKICRNRALVA